MAAKKAADTAAKVEEVKAVEKKAAAPKAEKKAAAPKKAAAKKVAAPVEEKKEAAAPVAEKAAAPKAEKKVAAPKAEKKAAAPKAEKKAAAPKKAVKASESVFVEFNGGQVDIAEIVAKVKAVAGNAKELKVYYQPENNVAFYVADGKNGSVNL